MKLKSKRKGERRKEKKRNEFEKDGNCENFFFRSLVVQMRIHKNAYFTLPNELSNKRDNYVLKGGARGKEEKRIA